MGEKINRRSCRLLPALLRPTWRASGRRGLRDLHERGAGLFLKHVLAVEFHHALVLGLLLEFGVAGADLLFARGLGDAQAVEIVLLLGGDDLLAEDEGVVAAAQGHGLAAGEDFVAAVRVEFGKSTGTVLKYTDIR